MKIIYNWWINALAKYITALRIVINKSIKYKKIKNLRKWNTYFQIRYAESSFIPFSTLSSVGSRCAGTLIPARAAPNLAVFLVSLSPFFAMPRAHPECNSQLYYSPSVLPPIFFSLIQILNLVQYKRCTNMYQSTHILWIHNYSIVSISCEVCLLNIRLDLHSPFPVLHWCPIHLLDLIGYSLIFQNRH